MKKFVIGLIVGIIITGTFEGIAYLIFGESFWNNPKTFFDYHFHHSLFGILALIVGLILILKKNYTAYFWIGLGIGIIVVHTLTDGRLIFIEKLLN